MTISNYSYPNFDMDPVDWGEWGESYQSLPHYDCLLLEASMRIVKIMHGPTSLTSILPAAIAPHQSSGSSDSNKANLFIEFYRRVVERAEEHKNSSEFKSLSKAVLKIAEHPDKLRTFFETPRNLVVIDTRDNYVSLSSPRDPLQLIYSLLTATDADRKIRC